MPRTQPTPRQQLIREATQATLHVFMLEGQLLAQTTSLLSLINASSLYLDDTDVAIMEILLSIITMLPQLLSTPALATLRKLEQDRYISRRPLREPRKLSRATTLDALYNSDYKTFLLWFRMSRQMFDSLVAGISNHPVFHRGGTNPQMPIRYQVMVAVWRMAHDGNGAGVRQMGCVFCIADGSVMHYTWRVQTAIVETYGASSIAWPDEQERKKLHFKQLHKAILPHCIGYLDGCLIPLVYRPVKDGNAYWTRKHVYAMNLMAVCDIDRRIRYIHAGFCGSANDQRILSCSPLGLNPDQFFSNTEDAAKGYYILADSGYVPTPYIIPMFRTTSTGRAPTLLESDFNMVMAGQRSNIENVFGMLKMRWHSLCGLRVHMGNEVDGARMNTWITSCAILHNLMLGEPQLSDEELQDRVPGIIAARESGLGGSCPTNQGESSADDTYRVDRRTVTEGTKKRDKVMEEWDRYRGLGITNFAIRSDQFS